MQAVHSPKASASQNKDSEFISAVSSVFYPNCLDPGGTSLFQQMIYPTLEPLSTLTSSPWTSIFFLHFSLAPQFPKSTSSFAVPSRIRKSGPASSGHHLSLLKLVGLFPEHLLTSAFSLPPPSPSSFYLKHFSSILKSCLYLRSLLHISLSQEGFLE